MILAVDVQYKGNKGFVSGVLFEDWSADTPRASHAYVHHGVAEYVPGEFYKRELPCILGLLQQVKPLPEYIVIDGFVFLDGASRPGLGKHLYDELQGQSTVIGVAKTSFASMTEAHKVFRGDSQRPLYVTCAGEALAEAQARIAMMHGPHRIPTLLKLADQMCRQAAAQYVFADE